MYSVILMPNAEEKEEVAVVEDGENSEEAEFQDAETTPLNISLHALYGTTPTTSTLH